MSLPVDGLAIHPELIKKLKNGAVYCFSLTLCFWAYS